MADCATKPRRLPRLAMSSPQLSFNFAERHFESQLELFPYYVAYGSGKQPEANFRLADEERAIEPSFELTLYFAFSPMMGGQSRG